jgi:CRISPR-associated protein Cas2
MPMTVVVTTAVADRFRGFLASCMLELAPGVYTAPRMSRAVRERVWAVMEDWFSQFEEGSIVMAWQDLSQPGGQGVEILGEPPKELHNYDGVILTRRAVAEPIDKERSLTK